MQPSGRVPCDPDIQGSRTILTTRGFASGQLEFLTVVVFLLPLKSPFGERSVLEEMNCCLFPPLNVVFYPRIFIINHAVLALHVFL